MSTQPENETAPPASDGSTWGKIKRVRRKIAEYSIILEDYSPAFSFVIVFFVCYAVVPKFKTMFEEMQIPLPLMTKAALAFAPWSALLLPMAFVFARLIWVWRRTGRTRQVEVFRAFVVFVFILWIGWFVAAFFMTLVNSMHVF